jgi:hypothetical protein
MSKLDDLILTLQKQEEIYDKVLNLSKDKKKIIVENKIKELEDLTRKEETLVASLLKLESIRDKIVDEISQEKGIKQVQNITELYKYIDPYSKQKIESIKQRLGGTVDELQKENDLTRQLIEQSLDYIKFNLDLMLSLDEKLGYSKGAVDNESRKKNLFDVKV